MTARVCARTGWTWEYVWSVLSIDRIEAMLAHWAQEPTADVLVAAFVGFKPPSRPSEDGGKGAIEELMAFFPKEVIRGG